MGFLRPEHDRLAEALASMDPDLLFRCRCYFGGGTAVVLKHGEYRLSEDIDFLCSDLDGYRELRTLAVQNGLAAFFGEHAEQIREFKADQYGLRTILKWRGQAIRFEIVREARIELDGQLDRELHVPVLTREDQVAEKLLANADRCLDRSVAYRDAIDLGYLVGDSGDMPPAAIRKAEAAYGTDVSRKIAKVLHTLHDTAEIQLAADRLQMKPSDVRRAIDRLRIAGVRAWPGLEIATFDEPAA